MLPGATDLEQAAAVLGAIPDGAVAVVDGLCLGGMADLAVAHGGRLRLVALIHHPLAMETGLTPTERDRLGRQERKALGAVVRVIVTSSFTAGELGAYRVPPEMIGVVPPGTDPAPLAAGSGDGIRRLLCAASLTPRKGHDVLLEALSRLGDRPWRLTLAGSPDRDPSWAAHIRNLVNSRRLESRVHLAGEVGASELDALYHGADLFVLASHYEGYGMVLAEALARGLPMVSTTGGAIPHTVPADSALLVPPGDSAALAVALARVLDDEGLSRGLAAAARRRRRTLPTWGEAVTAFARELDKAASCARL